MPGDDAVAAEGRAGAPGLSARGAARVLAIDPALRNCGWAVLEPAGAGRLRALGYGVLHNPDARPLPESLGAIADGVEGLIAEYRPRECAVEAVIYVQSVRTAISLGAARGVVLACAARAGMGVYEYAPRLVKRAVVGRGGAVKGQVGFMVRVLLGLEETPTGDAADALAVGIAHLQARVARGHSGR